MVVVILENADAKLDGLDQNVNSCLAIQDVKNMGNVEMEPVYAHKAGMEDIVLYVSLFSNFQFIFLR